MDEPREGEYSTFAYKCVGGVTIHFDAYLPSKIPSKAKLAAVVYFHGGGLTVGNRRSWFPDWLRNRVNAAGHAFISADYRLLPSGKTTGHDILSDITDLFEYLEHAELTNAPSESHSGLSEVRVGIDIHRIAVAGSSAGGLCAYLAAIHVNPRPKAVLSLYAQGGDFTIDHYLKPKTEVFFRGRELLDPADYPDFIYPFTSSSTSTVVIADSSRAYHPETGFPSNPRMFVARLWLQLGVFLDYFVGEHEPSLSKRLHAESEHLDEENLRRLIPTNHHLLIPQLNVTPSWPPTFLCHGSVDTAVHLCESEHMYGLLKKHGVEVELRVLDGKDHSFDYEPEAEKTFAAEFDEMVEFLNLHLRVRGRSERS